MIEDHFVNSPFELESSINQLNSVFDKQPQFHNELLMRKQNINYDNLKENSMENANLTNKSVSTNVPLKMDSAGENSDTAPLYLLLKLTKSINPDLKRKDQQGITDREPINELMIEKSNNQETVYNSQNDEPMNPNTNENAVSNIEMIDYCNHKDSVNNRTITTDLVNKETAEQPGSGTNTLEVSISTILQEMENTEDDSIMAIDEMGTNNSNSSKSTREVVDLTNYVPNLKLQLPETPYDNYAPTGRPSRRKAQKLQYTQSDYKELEQLNKQESKIVSSRRGTHTKQTYIDWHWQVNFTPMWLSTTKLASFGLAIHSLWGFIYCTKCAKCVLNPITHLFNSHGILVESTNGTSKIEREFNILGVEPVNLLDDPRLMVFHSQGTIDCIPGIQVRKNLLRCLHCGTVSLNSALAKCCLKNKGRRHSLVNKQADVETVERAQSVYGEVWMAVKGAYTKIDIHFPTYSNIWSDSDCSVDEF